MVKQHVPTVKNYNAPYKSFENSIDSENVPRRAMLKLHD